MGRFVFSHGQRVFFVARQSACSVAWRPDWVEFVENSKFDELRSTPCATLAWLGLASAKRQIPAKEVAALAGHVSCSTATIHYAKSRTGRALLKVVSVELSAHLSSGQVRTGEDR